jgi:hypothetical protein
MLVTHHHRKRQIETGLRTGRAQMFHSSPDNALIILCAQTRMK